MLRESDIIQARISPAEMAYLRRCAERAEIGGRSHIRGADRQDKLRQDQLTGMLGHYAAIRELFGNPWLFRLQRHFANTYPLDSDGGSDLPGARLDVKSSLLTKPNMLDYRLPVRPRELHSSMNYLLALIRLEPEPTAFLVGWCSASMLPRQTETSGPFAGAHVIRASELNPLMKLGWFDEARPPTKQQAGPLELNADAIRW